MSYPPVDRLLDTIDVYCLRCRKVAAECVCDDQPRNSDMPTERYRGVLAIGDVKIRVSVLDDGRRVLHADDMGVMLGTHRQHDCPICGEPVSLLHEAADVMDRSGAAVIHDECLERTEQENR